uniref:SHSP domain-containing protein n=1 Tax=Davidia involucrata TaxID=16924 RepID=A0A5B7AIW9_DAVIN
MAFRAVLNSTTSSSRSLLNLLLLRRPNKPYATRSFHFDPWLKESDYDDVGAMKRRREMDLKSERNPFLVSGPRGAYEFKDVKDGFVIRVDMPGIGKDEAKVWAENEFVFLKGYGSKASEHDETGRNYGGHITLVPGIYNMEAIEFEIKNGVLRVFIPKLKLQGKIGVLPVQVLD